jgi:hypothetical protein
MHGRYDWPEIHDRLIPHAWWWNLLEWNNLIAFRATFLDENYRIVSVIE